MRFYPRDRVVFESPRSLLFNGKKQGDSSIQYQTYITSRCIYKYTGRLQRPAGGDTSRALSTLYTDPLRAL